MKCGPTRVEHSLIRKRVNDKAQHVERATQSAAIVSHTRDEWKIFFGSELMEKFRLRMQSSYGKFSSRRWLGGKKPKTENEFVMDSQRNVFRLLNGTFPRTSGRIPLSSRRVLGPVSLLPPSFLRQPVEIVVEPKNEQENQKFLLSTMQIPTEDFLPRLETQRAERAQFIQMMMLATVQAEVGVKLSSRP